MMHETSVKAASNTLAYQWFAMRGSEKGSKDPPFYSHCRSLQISRKMSWFYQTALASLALKLIFTRANKLYG